jgi:LmbE family N-acetylglucosaminyl deacetylase
MKDKVLVVVAHPDDEILGCGGTLIKHIKNKDQVQVVFTSDSFFARKHTEKITKKNTKSFREKKAKKVSNMLGFKDPIFLSYPNLVLSRLDILNLNNDLKKIIQKYLPNIVYTHFYNDLHHDHRATYEATLIACKTQYFSSIKKILSIEIPSATEQCLGFGNNNFNPNIFVDIKTSIHLKKKAIKIYKDELLSYPNSRSEKGIENISQFRGNMVGLEYAESFELIREIKS